MNGQTRYDGADTQPIIDVRREYSWSRVYTSRTVDRHRARRAWLVLGSLLVLAAVVVGLALNAKPASAATDPWPYSGPTYVVVQNIDSSWPISESLKWLEPYTGYTYFHRTSYCPADRPCIVIRKGAVSGDPVAWTNTWVYKRTINGKYVWYLTAVITIDTAKATQRKYSWAAKKWLPTHEIGHWAALPHSSSTGNFMYPYIRRSCSTCYAYPPTQYATAAQRQTLHWR